LNKSLPGNLPKHDIKDITLAETGALRAEWASREMPVLKSIKARFLKEKPLKGKKIACCLHITSETANLVETLVEGGAEVFMCASNPLSTQDDIAAYLVSQGISVYAIKGELENVYDDHLEAVLEEKPHLTIDDGADLVAKLHSSDHVGVENMIGSMEETTTGIIRLKVLSDQGKLKFPVISVNDSDTKHMFDNRYGTGQSTLDGIIRATNILIAGKSFVIVGYGWCGRGLASRAKGMGARTIICEIDPVKALEAVMDGHEIMPMDEASRIGNIFVTVTGGLHAIDEEHFNNMMDGTIVANSGHFNVEINLKALEKMTESSRKVRDNVQEYTLESGKKIFVLGEGRLINLAAAEGHPPSVMDMSFANQALASEYLIKNHSDLKNIVHVLPKKIDQQIATLKINSMKMNFDSLKEKQIKYFNSWELGTGSSQENL
jgi:adenosylhomocysteinase